MDTDNGPLHHVSFTWVDYSLFSGMLILSIGIGIYFGCFGTKQKSKSDYLMGGKTMKVIPIAISLIASDTSGISLLAIPADIYRYGACYVWTCVSWLIICLATSFIYLPVFHKLQLTSAYEYLNLRFDGKIRTFASFLFALSMLFYNPIVIYIPALALEQATGLSLHLICTLVCVTCIFYTALGGLKAVVWVDTIQTALMFAAMTLIFALGILSEGGISRIWHVSLEGRRLDVLDFNIDPTIRDGICATLIGSLFVGLNNVAVSQANVQRFLAVPTLADARKVLVVFFVGILVVKLYTAFTGLIMYARYANCDPLSNGIVTRPDQILPYYIMDVAGHIPGLPGLFIAGIFSASLSTLSGTLNTLAATIYEDFVRPFMNTDISEENTNRILKLTAVICGIICTSMVLLVERMGAIFPLIHSTVAICAGPLVGMFTLGMLFPIANAKGALCGAISGLAFATWVITGSFWYKKQNNYIDPIKPFSTTGCNFQVNLTITETNVSSEAPFYLYRVTFWYYTLMGTFVTITIGILVSWFTKDSYPPVHQDLLSPALSIFKCKTNLKKIEAYSLRETRPLNDVSINSKN